MSTKQITVLSKLKDQGVTIFALEFSIFFLGGSMLVGLADGKGEFVAYVLLFLLFLSFQISVFDIMNIIDSKIKDMKKAITIILLVVIEVVALSVAIYIIYSFLDFFDYLDSLGYLRTLYVSIFVYIQYCIYRVSMSTYYLFNSE